MIGRLTLKPDRSGQFQIAEGRIGLGGLVAAMPIFGNVVAGACYTMFRSPSACASNALAATHSGMWADTFAPLGRCRIAA